MEKTYNKDKRLHLLIIAVIFFFYAINNYLWLLRNRSLLSFDEGAHLWTSLRFVRAFTHPAHNIFYELLHANTTHWPPLYHFIASLFSLVFGPSYIVSVMMTNMLFFIALIVSLYLLGRKMHKPSAGILAGCILSLYPVIYGHSRMFLLDLPLTAGVTFSVYCLLSTDGFKDMKYSMIFALSAGLGMLIKWSYVFFVLPLFVYEAVRSLRGIKGKDPLYKVKIRNLFIITLISLVVASVWYLTRMEKTMYAAEYFIILADRCVYDPIEALRWTAQAFREILSLSFVIPLIPCLAVFCLRKDPGYKVFSAIWCLVPVLILSYQEPRQARFFMPILPCLALITAVGMDTVKNRRIKNVILVFVFMAGLTQYFNASLTASERGKDWKHEQIANSFLRHADEPRYYPFMLGIICSENDADLSSLFGNHAMNYYLQREFIESDTDILWDVVIAPNRNDEAARAREARRFVNFMSDIQGILYISKDAQWPTADDLEYVFSGEDLKDRRLIGFLDSKEKFDHIDRIPLPQGYYANLYLYRMPEIKKNTVSVRPFNGRIKLFYGQNEVTKDIGLVSEFVYKGRVYKYRDGVFRVYNISDHHFKMVSEWPDIGIRQVTSVVIDSTKEKSINIKATIESPRDIVLDAWYVNTLVSDKYKHWVRPYLKGAFKDISIFPDSDRFERLDTGYTGPDIAGLEGNREEGLPAILFEASGTDIPVSCGVSNTNYYHNARCVYVTADKEIHLKQGTARDILELTVTLLDDAGLKDAMSDAEQKTRR